MQAEVISIGDELTTGQRLDTNSQWLGTQLTELGVTVLYHTTVADDLEANVHVFRAAVERADIVVASGGLGPTADDLTREAIAAAAGVPLVRNDQALADIERLFARRKRPMPESNRLQAMFPSGSRVITNPSGTAPGIDLDVSRAGRSPSRIFALPGVPSEMKEMWAGTVAPAIGRMFAARRVIRHRRIKCFGIGESDLEQMLPDLIRRGRTPLVGITVSGATITLRITAAGETPEACFAAMEPTVATIRECLGTLVFGEEDEELEHAVLRLLHDRGQTLATAEWGSGGMLAHWLSEAPAGRGRYLGGVVVPSLAAAEALLPLSPWAERAEPTHLKSARSAEDVGKPEETAAGRLVAAMAVACRERLGADYGLAVSELPIHDPNASTANAGEPPKFFYAVAGPDDLQVRASPFIGHPDILKTRAGKQALNLLRLELLAE